MPKEIRTLVVEEICPWPYYQPYAPWEKVEIIKRAYVRKKPLAPKIKKGKTPWQREQEKEAAKKRAERSSRKPSCSGTASGRLTRSGPSEGTAATM